MTPCRGRELDHDPAREPHAPAASVPGCPVVDAALVAPHLGLSPEAFWRELGRGIVYGVVERGEGEDAGRTRLTFRYRARSWSLVVEG